MQHDAAKSDDLSMETLEHQATAAIRLALQTAERGETMESLLLPLLRATNFSRGVLEEALRDPDRLLDCEDPRTGKRARQLLESSSRMRVFWRSDVSPV